MRLHQQGKEFLASIFKTYCWGFRWSSGGKGVHPTLLHHIPHLSNCVLAVSLWLENVCICNNLRVHSLLHHFTIFALTFFVSNPDVTHDGSTYMMDLLTSIGQLYWLISMPRLLPIVVKLSGWGMWPSPWCWGWTWWHDDDVVTMTMEMTQWSCWWWCLTQRIGYLGSVSNNNHALKQ